MAVLPSASSALLLLLSAASAPRSSDAFVFRPRAAGAAATQRNDENALSLSLSLGSNFEEPMDWSKFKAAPAAEPAPAAPAATAAPPPPPPPFPPPPTVPATPVDSPAASTAWSAGGGASPSVVDVEVEVEAAAASSSSSASVASPARTAASYRPDDAVGAPEDSDSSSNRYRATIDNAAEEFVCYITMDLPVDPVTAEDGRTYERSAIEEHIRRNEHDLRSPVTNQRMGPRLFPAVQVRNLLEKLVQSGAIAGTKADRWNQRMRYEKEVAETEREAAAGDAKAMRVLGQWYADGDKGLKKDKGLSYSWFKRAAEAGDQTSMVNMAGCLCTGDGVEKNEGMGMALLGAAAGGGSAVAALALGRFFFNANHGFPRDWEMAKFWLKKALDNRDICDDVKDEDVNETRQYLEQIRKEDEWRATGESGQEHWGSAQQF